MDSTLPNLKDSQETDIGLLMDSLGDAATPLRGTAY